MPESEMAHAASSSGTAWRLSDLIVFAAFFGATVALLPLSLVRIWRAFNPELRLTNLTATDQVILQGISDLIIVGFIAFLVRVVHRRSFIQTIHWYRNHQFRTGFLISLGATLAISVLIVSARFPAGEPPPIERLLSSRTAMWTFALFGIGVAPLFEEIIFRGFLFKVLQELRGSNTAVLTTAILFALLHLPQLWGSWAGVVLIFVVGYVLSYVRHRSNSLIPPFIIHTSYNGMLFSIFLLSSLLQTGAR
jgi:membrane protease YdiL (CAAX protease family)